MGSMSGCKAMAGLAAPVEPVPGAADAHVDLLTRFPLLHTCDLDESRAVMGDFWGPHLLELAGRANFETLVNRAEIGQLGLSYVRCATPLRVSSTLGGDCFTLYLHEEGTAEHLLNGESAVASPDAAVVVVPGQEGRMQSGPVRLLALDFPRVRVEQALSARGLPTVRFESWARCRDLTSPAGAALRSLSRWSARELDQAGTPLVGGLPAEHLEQTLFSLFLACLAEPLPPACPPGPMLGKIKLTDLESWIELNLKQPLSIDVLAGIAGVSPRAVQMAFRRYRDCTPLEYIRRARLNAIRRELLARGGKGAVTEIAMDYGFFHMGRFPDAYRRAFGELPKETLWRLRGRLMKRDERQRDT